jgi:hypothetical protein
MNCPCCGQPIPDRERPTDLITQAEAAALVSVKVPSISQAMNNGRLTIWENDSPNPRKGRRLVSKAEVLAKFTKA